MVTAERAPGHRGEIVAGGGDREDRQSHQLKDREDARDARQHEQSATRGLFIQRGQSAAEPESEHGGDGRGDGKGRRERAGQPGGRREDRDSETTPTKTATIAFAGLMAEPLQHPGKQAVPIR